MNEKNDYMLSMKNYDVSDLTVLTLNNIMCIKARIDKARSSGFLSGEDIADLVDSAVNANSCIGELAKMGLSKLNLQGLWREKEEEK